MRGKRLDPAAYGIQLTPEAMVNELDVAFREKVPELSVDEVLLRPTLGLELCHYIRSTRRWYDLPEEVILRALLGRRKHPKKG